MNKILNKKSVYLQKLFPEKVFLHAIDFAFDE